MVWPQIDPGLWTLWKEHTRWLSYATWGFWSAVTGWGFLHVARGWGRLIFASHDAERRAAIWEIIRGVLMWSSFDLWLAFKAYLRLKGGG